MIRSKNGLNIKDLNKTSQEIIVIACVVCGQKYETTYYNYNYNQRAHPCTCKKCLFTCRSPKSFNTKKAPYYEKIKNKMIKEGYSIITTFNEYISSDAYIQSTCPNNHTFTVTYKEWNIKNKRCGLCREENQLQRIANVCDQNKFILLDVKEGQVFFKCSEGHDGIHSLSNFYKGTNCATCSSQKRRSNGEKEIEDFLTSLQIHVESSNRTLIHPYELDLYIPDHKIAIEYDGKLYHSEGYKDNKYHLMKTEMCEEQGIQLIHIFDDEWELQQRKVKNRLKSILGLNEKLYARKCTVKPIEYAQAKLFCEEHHTQNYGQSSVKLGLFHDNALVSVMTFSKLSISKGSKSKVGSWELNRFCSTGNVIGGAGKLLSYFKRNYPWMSILSFADRRWSQGSLYKQIGFDFIGYTKPSYWYWNKGKSDIIRHHRFKHRKSEIKHLGKGTEWEIMQSLGWSRIWDCGNLKFEMVKS